MSAVISLERPAQRLIRIHTDVVVKVQDPAGSRKERLRTLAGREIGHRTGLFVVPAIRSFNDDRGEITFERLEMSPLQEELSRGERSFELVSRAARALTAIHLNLDVPEPTAAAPGTVALHGDFALRNIFYMAATDQIAVIDWSLADWIGFGAEVGPPEIDVAIFLTSLFHRRVFAPWPVARRHELARHFVSSYAATSPVGIDPVTLRKIVASGTPALNRLLRHRKGSLKALIYRHSMIDLDLFLRRLSDDRFPGRVEHRIG
jgi:tRNA A-37 threonylcarbamoyl transferase component Bud32